MKNWFDILAKSRLVRFLLVLKYVVCHVLQLVFHVHCLNESNSQLIQVKSSAVSSCYCVKSIPISCDMNSHGASFIAGHKSLSSISFWIEEFAEIYVLLFSAPGNTLEVVEHMLHYHRDVSLAGADSAVEWLSRKPGRSQIGQRTAIAVSSFTAFWPSHADPHSNHLTNQWLWQIWIVWIPNRLILLIKRSGHSQVTWISRFVCWIFHGTTRLRLIYCKWSI
jgi:hypothetical protein